MFMQPLI